MSDIERIPKGNDVCLIDADSLLYYEMGKSTFEEAIYGLDERISSMLNACNTSYYAGFLTKGRCFRYEVDTEYKAKRKNSKNKRPIIFPALMEHLRRRWGFTYMPELEADDLVSYYSHNTERKTIICSPDKDVLYQCVGMHFNYRTTEFIHTSPEEALKFEPFALRKYVEKYGMTEGIFKFTQTFRLVYLLTTDADIEREIGPKKVPELVILDNNSVDPEEW